MSVCKLLIWYCAKKTENIYISCSLFPIAIIALPHIDCSRVEIFLFWFSPEILIVVDDCNISFKYVFF